MPAPGLNVSPKKNVGAESSYLPVVLSKLLNKPPSYGLGSWDSFKCPTGSCHNVTGNLVVSCNCFV